MAQYVPHYEDFKTLKKWKSVTTLFFYLNLIFPLVVGFKPHLARIFVLDNGVWTVIYSILDIITFISLVGYAVIDTYIEYFIVPAVEEKRKADFLDNAFGTHILAVNSVGYYTNDDIDQGVYKAAVNLFENSLFTYRVAQAMLFKRLIPVVVVLIGVIILAEVGWYDQPLAIPMLQFFFSSIIALDFVKYLILFGRSKRIYEGWHNLFRTTNINQNHSSQIPEILRYWLTYESMLARLQVSLDDETFDKLNDELSEEWERIKNNLNIN